MAKYCMVNNIKEECIEQYTEAHKNFWPELREVFRASGAKECTIFLYGKQSILYLESEDLDKTFDLLGQDETNQKWQAMGKDWFENPDGFQVNLTDMVFDLNEV